jgi:hypothetical protein
MSHAVRGGLETTTTGESLASFHLYIQEAAYLLRAAHNGQDYVDIAPDGHYIFHKKKDLNIDALKPGVFSIDPIALAQFRAMVLSMQERGAAIVYVVPPIYEPFYQAHQAEFETYLKTIVPQLPDAPVINFQGPAYSSLSGDPDNFCDVWHTDAVGADKFSPILGEFEQRALQGDQ